MCIRDSGKTQVTVEYDESGAPKRVDTIVISSQHSADVSLDQISSDIVKYVIKPIVPENLLDDDTIIYVNPTGRFAVSYTHLKYNAFSFTFGSSLP